MSLFALSKLKLNPKDGKELGKVCPEDPYSIDMGGGGVL